MARRYHRRSDELVVNSTKTPEIDDIIKTLNKRKSIKLYMQQNGNPNSENTNDNQLINWLPQRNLQTTVENVLEHGNSDPILAIRDAVQSVAECIPDGVVFPQGGQGLQLGSHASDPTPLHLKFDYPSLEGNAAADDHHHGMTAGAYGSLAGLTCSQWQSSYAAAAASLMSSMAQNQYSLLQGMMENVPGTMSQQQEDESSSYGARLSSPQDDAGIDASFQSTLGDDVAVTGPECE